MSTETLVRKCEQYWPEIDQQCAFGDLTVKNTSEERVEYISGLIVRSLKVTNRSNECQEFTQYQYTNWPESWDSANLKSLIELVDLVRRQSPSRESYNLVHCSGGAGRTGTFIGIYWIMDMIDKGAEKINVFNTVLEMRRQRPQMVRMHFLLPGSKNANP